MFLDETNFMGPFNISRYLYLTLCHYFSGILQKWKSKYELNTVQTAPQLITPAKVIDVNSIDQLFFIVSYSSLAAIVVLFMEKFIHHHWGTPPSYFNST